MFMEVIEARIEELHRNFGLRNYMGVLYFPFHDILILIYRSSLRNA